MLRLHRFVLALARLMAVLGGICLTALILLTCLSVLGRELNGLLHSDVLQAVAPGLAEWLLSRNLPGLWGDGGIRIRALTGDFELVEAGMAFCIFAFLPYCQVTAGHASVDILTKLLPERANRLLVFLGELLFAVALVIIAKQLELGLERKMRSGQSTMLLQMPIWWAYMASFVGAVAAAAAAIYMSGVRFYELLSGQVVAGATGGQA